MDSVTDDLELTKDTMKLLHKELKMLRAQLCDSGRNETPSEGSGPESILRDRANAAEAELVSLKLEIENLRNHNATLKDDLDLLGGGSNPDEKSLLLQYKVSHDKILEQLQHAVEEKEHLNREKDEKDYAQTQLHDKLSSSRGKYKALKIANRELQSALEVLHHDLTEVTNQKDEAEKKHQSPFDPEEFLGSSGATLSKNQPEFDSIKPYSKKLHFSISMDVKRLCARDGLLTLSKHEVIWSPTDIGTGLVIMPFHRYNPKLNAGGSGGAWERKSLGFDIGQQRSLFHRDMSWYYLGTYECVDAGTIDLSKLRELSTTIEDTLYKNTVLFPDLVPPFLRNMVPAMYSVDVLKITYIAIRCVGFSRDLYQMLLKNGCGIHTAIPGKAASTGTKPAKRPLSDSNNEGGRGKKSKKAK